METGACGRTLPERAMEVWANADAASVITELKHNVNNCFTFSSMKLTQHMEAVKGEVDFH
jgi:hypothetical protein